MDPIDPAYIYNENEENNLIFLWLQENDEQVLDEKQSKLYSRIASEKGIDVVEYKNSSRHSHGNTLGLGSDSDTHDDDTQPQDDDDGGIGDVAPPAIEELQG